MNQILTSGWTLGCEYMDPISISRPDSIFRALSAAGCVDSGKLGYSIREEAWLFTARFEYALGLPMPAEADEHFFLCFDQLRGAGCVYLNDRRIAAFLDGPLFLDVTGALQEENTVRVVIEPELPTQPDAVRDAGIVGAVRLRSCNYLRAVNLRAHCAGDGLALRLDLDVYTAGKYTVNYTVTRQGELLARQSFTERLGAAERRVAHSIPLDDAEGAQVRAQIERMGVGCEDCVTSIEGAEPAADGIAADGRDLLFMQDAEGLKGRIETLKALGVARLSLHQAEQRPFMAGHTLYGLPVVSPDSRSRVISAPGPGRYALFEESAGRRANLFELMKRSDPVYRAMLPEGAVESARAVSALRMIQAEYLVDQAHECLVEGRPIVLSDVFEQRPQWVGGALVEADGRARPAYWALQRVLSGAHAFVLAPNLGRLTPGEMAKLDVWFAGSLSDPGPMSVGLTAYDEAGYVLASTSFTAYADRTIRLGAMAIRVPRAPAAITLRAVTTRPDGSALTVDKTLTAGISLYEALTRSETTINRQENLWINSAKTVALKVASPAYTGALLPGESFAAEPGGETVETN